jgi:hypothetical protein
MKSLNGKNYDDKHKENQNDSKKIFCFGDVVLIFMPCSKYPCGCQKGEMTVTSSYWMVNEMEGQKEIENFYKKLAEKLGFLPGQGGLEEIMSRITRTNPQLAEAIKKVQEESKKLSGVPLRTHTVYETKKVAVETNKQEEEQKTEIPTSVGGLFKKFGKKVAKSNEEAADQNVLMETNTEVTKFEVAPIDAKEFAVPENYKLQKN